MLALGWVIYGYFGLVVGSLPPLLTSIKADLGLSSTQAGLLLGAWPLVFIAVALQAGQLNDRLGLRRSVLIAITLITGSVFLRGLAHSFPVMFCAVAMFGLGGSIISTGLPKLVAQWFEGPARTRASGIYLTGPSVGTAVALAGTNSVILPAVGDDWHRVFFVYAAIGVFALGIWVLFGRDGPAARAGTVAPSKVPTSQVLRLWPMWIVIFVGVAGFTMGGFRGWLPAILEAKDFSRSEAGWIASITGLVGVPGSLSITNIASRLPRRKPLVIAMFAVSAVTLAVVPISSGPILIAVLVVQGFFAGALVPILMNLLMDLPELGPGAVGTAAGIFFTVAQAGGFGSPFLIGVISGASGSFTSSLYLLSVIAVVAIIPAAAIHEVARGKLNPQVAT